MDKPRIFLGSSGKQARLLKSLTGGLATVAEVEPWTGVFNPGSSTLDTLVRLTREVDFAAFVFAQDDWTTPTPGDPGTAVPARPRRVTTWSSRLGCSAARSACAGPSSCTRTIGSPTDLG